MLRKPSKKLRRHNGILDALALNPTMRVNALARELDVSAETVRRDLVELEQAGRIRRTYGGAVRVREFEPALTERLKLHIEERDRIARHAVDLVGDAASIFIGGGATTLHFARALRSTGRKITVLTPTFSIATELALNPLIEVMVLPGVVEPKEGLACGPETLRYIAQYKTALAVMGASAVNEEGVSEALLVAAQIYSAMLDNADRNMILADSSKFGKRSLQMILRWNSRVTLITEAEPPSVFRHRIEQLGAILAVA
ncbi:MAG: DeoR/GlpR family DNA-binding transcription regulator [Pikeienuella sp.]